MVARHPRRPYTLDYLSTIFTDFIELHGDRLYMDDPAIVGGWARLAGVSVMVIGHQKGRDTKENLKRNFGMPHPEGYRKALRLMKLAAKFSAPVITLIDTPGAYPGLGAEERGQSEALARNILEMSALPTPVVAVVIGEGGSGGALALGVADRILMLENSVYSVISPEGCAAILWKDASQRERAAEALKITAEDLLAPQGHRRDRDGAGGRRAHRSRRRRRGAPRSADPARHRAPEDPPREAGPPPRREVRRDGRLLRGLMSQTVEVRFKGTRKAYFTWDDADAPLRARRAGRWSRWSAAATSAGSRPSATWRTKKCGSGCSGCAVGGEAAPAEPTPPKPVLRRATARRPARPRREPPLRGGRPPQGHRAGPRATSSS